MNKVFKVIWNEARNAYVVVSEIAKNRGSKSCSTKKLLAMLIATGVMTCASFDVLAAQPTAAETARYQYVAFGDKTAGWSDGQEKTIDGHKYIYDATNKYWVREGYKLTVDENGKLHTPLSAHGKAADVAYIGGGDTGSILQSVTSMVSASGTVTNMGESLSRITASAFTGVSHSGGTAVVGDWNYIIQDSSWKGYVENGNFQDGYVDLSGPEGGMPKGFVTVGDKLKWDDTKQAYTYNGKPVDYSNVYVIDGKIGVFTNQSGSDFYKGTVFGKNNEILMTVKDADNNFYSYWASEVTDPSATMQSYRLAEYKKDLAVLVENDNKLHRDDIKEVTMTTDASTNSAIIGLVRNGNTEAGASVKGAITVTSGGGTGGQDTFVKISNDTANQTFATGSKVEAIGTTEATTGIKINGQEYKITDNDTTYTAGENVAIDDNHKISVNLSEYAKKTDVAVVYNDKNSLHSTNSGKVGEKAIAFGRNTIADGKFSVAIGDGANVDANGVYESSGNYSTAVGAASGAWGTQSTAVGYNAKTQGQNAVALGFSASASGKDTVAIGANSVANREAGAVGLYAPTGNSSSTWKATSGAVSIGSSTKTRQIINLAAGTADTDAVNVAQLKKVKAEADKHTTLVAGANVTLDKKETENGLQYTINAIGGSNYQAGKGIAIEAESNTISVKLQADSNLVVDSNGLALKKQLTGMESIQGAGEGKISFDGANVKVNNTTFGENSVVVGGGTDGKTPVTINGTDGVVSGLHNTNIGYTDFATKGNAATEEQLKKVMDAGWKFTTDSNQETTVKVGPDGTNANAVTFKGDSANVEVTNTGNNIKVALKNDLTVDSVKAGSSFMSATGIGYGDKAYITSSGLNANGQKITGVAAGNADTDAVNFGQLKETNTKVENLKVEAGKHTTLVAGENVQLNQENTDNGLQYTISAKDTTYAAGNGITISGENNAIAVNLKAGENNLEVTAAGLALKKDLNVDSVKADKFFMDKTQGVGYDGKAYINSSGLNANNQKITGVADGTDDTDAVNVGQLKTVSEVANQGWKLSTNGDAASKVAPGEIVDFSGDKNISVSHNGTKVKVELNDELEDIKSISNGDSRINLNADSISISNGNKYFAITNSGIGMSYITADYSAKSIMLGENGTTISGGLNVAGSKITGVAAGTIAAGSTDAVNGSQLNDIKNSINTDISNKTFGLKDDKGSEVTSTLGNTVQVKGADGITSTVKDGALEIGLKLQDNSNLVVNSNGLALNTALTGIQSITGAGGTINLAGSAITINETTFNKDGRIQNVAAGTETKDAVNFGQLDATNKKVDNLTTEVGKGWTVATDNGTATKVGAGDTVKFSGDDNIKVSNDGKDVKVELNKKLTVDSVKAGDFFMDKNEGVGYKGKAYITSSGLNANGQTITNVKAGEAETDAVNVGQLNAVKAEASKKTTLSDGKNTTVTSVTTDGQTDYQVNVAGDLKDITSVSNDASKINLNADSISISNGNKSFAITNSGIGMSYIGADYTAKSIMLGENGTTISGGLNVAGSKITGVAAGTADTDAVNVSQLNKVSEIANKGWKLKTNNGNVSDVKPGDEVEFDGDDNIKVSNAGNKVSFKLNNKLTGIESITGVGGGSISFSGGNVTINNNVTFGSNGQIHNVTAGTASTDAVNVGQLNAAVQAGNTDTHIKPGEYGVGADNKVNMDVVDKTGTKINTVTITDVAKASDLGNVNNINNDLKNPNGTTTVVDAVNNLNQKLDNKVGDLQYSKVDKGDIADGDSTTTAIGKLDQKLNDVSATAAKQHTTVSGSGNIVVEDPTINADGGKNYNVKLADDINVNSVTANTFKADKTIMDKDGLKVGEKVSVTENAVTAGKTSISDEGVKVGDKTYISDKGLNANGQNITNVADGKVEKDSKDAINGGQLFDTETKINNRIDGVENQVISNSNRIGQLSSRVNKVGAGAAALAALHPMDFDPDDKLTFSAGYGNYAGQNAAAIGAYYRPDEKVMFSVGGTVGNGENMVNAGISFSLDRTNHVSNSRTALAREVIDLRGQLAEMGAKMAKMEKAFGMLDESKTKLFPDIPANHWAYEYIAKLAGNGYIEGYPDGSFGGDRLMTRYEFATMLYRAIENGAALEERIIKEFEPELGRIRVDRISGEDGDRDKIERVRVNDTKGERDHYGNKLAK